MNNSSIAAPKRIASWWITWEDLNWPHQDAYDKIKRRAEGLAKAGATTAMIFGTHFRWDYMPYFILLHDYLATVAEELGKYGLELYDHHSVCLVHRYGTKEEMRNVMLHSGPHLPFSPSYEAAASWEYNGTKLNDWRMIDVVSGKPMYYPQYTAESFCVRNPMFIEAYKKYVKDLVSSTGIKGLSADDPIHFTRYRTCGCEHCRNELKRRTGMDLPSYDDRTFWGNWENEAWKEWIDMRLDATGNFMKEVFSVLPDDFRLTSCGGGSASGVTVGTAQYASAFLKGSNYLNLELVGNTPAYKHDPHTSNTTTAHKIISAAHHQGAAREKGLRCFGTGFGFTEATSNIVWAVNKMLGADCWLSTLKGRLGLPEHILKTLPEEYEIVGNAFNFEKNHPELFDGEQTIQMGIFYSDKTKFETFFGNLNKGLAADYSHTVELMFSRGISASTVFDFDKEPKEYPIILVPSAILMSDEEITSMKEYIKRGGKVLLTGPNRAFETDYKWILPTSPTLENPIDFFSTKMNGAFPAAEYWLAEDNMPVCDAPLEIKEIAPSLYYTPHRMRDKMIDDLVLDIINKFKNQLPVNITKSEGYFVNIFESDDRYTVHFLAKDFDTEVDKELDEMRFHRSRVNYITKVTAIDVTDKLKLETNLDAEVYLPFNDENAQISKKDGLLEINLPKNTQYIIVSLKK